MKIDGHFVLPAIARWTVHGRGGLSSIFLDRSTTPSRLTGINYSRHGQAYIQSFDLDPNGLLMKNGRRTRHGMFLTNTFGHDRGAVHSVSSLLVPGTSYQGVGSAGAYDFANSSGLKMDGRRRRGVDATVVLKGGKVIERFRMPHGNGQSLYIDHRRGRYVSVTERGSQFLFELPLRQLTQRDER